MAIENRAIIKSLHLSTLNALKHDSGCEVKKSTSTGHYKLQKYPPKFMPFKGMLRSNAHFCQMMCFLLQTVDKQTHGHFL